jgi:hypothetical protein
MIVRCALWRSEHVCHGPDLWCVKRLLRAPANVPFPDHFALLQLSRDAEGRPRLVTTNFDTLFEHAARDGGLADVPSHAGISVPKAGG